MLRKVDVIKTNISIKDFISSLVFVWKELFGNIPTKQSVGVILSQWSIETGQGRSCWNYNIGNVKAFDIPGKNIDYIALKGVWEIVKGKRIVLSENDPGAWFLAFPTLNSGMKHHLNFLKNKRYKVAWSAVESGSVKDFAHLLKVNGYYTAPEADYVKGMNYYFNSYMKSKDYESAIKSLPNLISSITTPTTPIPAATSDQPVSEPNVTSTEPVAPSTPDKLIVPGWQGTIYNILANAPWVKAIEWIGSIFGKKN